MALLKSVENIPGVDCVDYRNTLYYKKYKYKATVNAGVVANFLNILTWKLKMKGVKKLDDTNFDEIASFVFKTSYTFSNKPPAVHDHVLTYKDDYITLNNVPKLKGKSELRVLSCSKSINIFSNDLALIQDLLSKLKLLSKFKIYQVEKNSIEIGVKYFARTPKHKYRIYCKNSPLDESKRKELMDFLRSDSKYHLSWNLSRFFNYTNYYNHYYLLSTYYLDYDDEQIGTYLILKYGEYFSKICKLEKHPDI